MKEKFAKAYEAFLSCVKAGDFDQAAPFYETLITLEKESRLELEKLGDLFWKKRLAGDEDGLSAIHKAMDAYILETPKDNGDPLALGSVSGFSRKESGSFRIHRFASLDRYIFDFELCKPELGWDQFDTASDASYFGIWVNKVQKMVVSYVEGDIYVLYCPTVEAFNAEIQEMIEFYEAGFICKTIGDEGVAEYRQDRQQFFIERA